MKRGDEVILFDTGTKAELLQENLRKLNLEPTQITAIAISHEHYDHTGGLESVLKQVEKHIKVYLPNDYKPELISDFNKIKFIVNDKYQKIADGVWLTTVFVNHNNGIKEQALVIEKEEKLIMITGCAHPGIADMCASVRNHFPDNKLELVTGGFHLMRTSEEQVLQISDRIKQLGFEYVAPSHCTGDNATPIFKTAWQDAFIHLNLGDTYYF